MVARLETDYKRLLEKVVKTSFYGAFDYQDKPEERGNKMDTMMNECKYLRTKLEKELAERKFELELMERNLERMERIFKYSVDGWNMQLEQYEMFTKEEMHEKEVKYLMKHWGESEEFVRSCLRV